MMKDIHMQTLAFNKKSLLTPHIEAKIQDIKTVLSNRLNSSQSEIEGGLMGGTAASSLLFFSYYENFFKSNTYHEEIQKSLLCCIEYLNNPTYLSSNFVDGLAGLSWLFLHIENMGIFKLDAQLLYQQVDDIAHKSALKSLKQKNYDFFYGAIGCGIYLLERLSEKSQYEKLEDILRGLSNIAIKTSSGFVWKDKPVSEDNNDQIVYNLGLAHGLASHIIFYSKMLIKEVNPRLSKELLKGSIDFLLNHKYKNTQGCVFPNMIIDGINSEVSRLAWCYGDLCCSIALWQAGQVLNDESIKQESIKICLHSTKRKNLNNTGVVDAGLCHGSAGIAQIYNRMYRYTGLLEFKEASVYWIEVTLKMARFEDGLAGYKAWEGGENKWGKEYGLLEGISGIGLALLSHISDKEPSWDRCFLLS